MDGVVMDFLLSDAIFGELRKQFGESRAAHAFLLECPDAYLRRDALRLLSAFAVCRDGGCLVCPDCRRAFKGVHCDVKFLPFDAEKGKITVADTDKLIEDVPLRPLNAKNKAYLLDASLSAGREEWQNKLLKTLEEPPENTFIFIATANAESLLQTVRSRCEILRIGGMEKEKIFDALCSRGIDEKNARFASGICGGQLSKAVAVAEDKKFIDTARFAVDFFARLKNTKKTPPFIAELNKRKDSALLFYEMAELIMRDAAAISCGLETALPDEFKEQLEVIAADYSPEAAASAVGHIEYAKRRTDSGGNFAVVADELVLKILEDKYRCRR